MEETPLVVLTPESDRLSSTQTNLVERGIGCYWCPDSVSWDVLRTLLEQTRSKGDPTGLDSEFQGWDWKAGTPNEEWDITKSSCYGNTRINYFSIGILTGVMHPRGYRRAVSFVLPAQALRQVGIQSYLEDSTFPKCVHNLPVDQHSFANHRIRLRGCRNTLSLLRWIFPERNEMRIRNPKLRPYGLKEFCLDVLGSDDQGHYEDEFSELVQLERMVNERVVRCACGKVPCRKRKTDPDHTRSSIVLQKCVLKQVRRLIPQHLIIPGHPRFSRMIPYAGWDAARAVEINNYCQKRWTGGKERIVPW